MVCELCATVGRMRSEAGVEGRPAPVVPGGVGVCDACGSPVERGASARVVDTLAQLARFGLAGQMILSRRRV